MVSNMSFIIKVFLVLLTSYSVLNVNSEHLELRNDTLSNDVIYKNFLDLDQNLKKIGKNLMKMAMPHIMKITEQVHLSTNCSKNAFQLISEASKLKLSALRILDATAKLQAGVLVGNTFLLGDYDECMSTTVINKNGKLAYKGQYCMFEVKPILPKMDSTVTYRRGFKGLKDAAENTSDLVQYLNSVAHYIYYFPIKAGVCIPSGCTSQDIDSIINYAADNTLLRIKTSYCDREHYAPTSNGKIVALCFFATFGLLAIVGLGIDCCSLPARNCIVKYLLCFSIKKNFPRVMSLKVADKSLAHLNGIRSLSVFYIILLHLHFFSQGLSMMGHMKDATDRLLNVADHIYLNGYLTSEVFFFIGGFINAYSRMKISQKMNGAKINCFSIVVNRLIRIYPAYIVGILTTFLLSYSYGPVRTEVIQKFVEPCDQFWWRNILFINNFFPQQETCMAQSWYIAADMQIFLLSLFTIPVFFKHPKRGIILHLAVLIGGLLTTAIWSYYKQIGPGFVDVNVENINHTWNVYTLPLPHIAPYFLGILIGFFLSINKDFKIPLVYQIIGWPVTGVAFISMLFMTHVLNGEERPPLLVSVLYFTFSKLIYVSAVAWMVVCCSRGCGGVINYILSLKVWIPISKLSFLMYILGPTIQMFYFANSPVLIESHPLHRIWMHIGDLGVILLVTLFVSPLVEAPLFAMKNLIFEKQPSNVTKGAKEVTTLSLSNSYGDKTHTSVELENNFQKENSDLKDR